VSEEHSRLAPYEAQLDSLWQTMVRTVGIHTVNVLMERAIFDSSQKYPELALIERTDEGLKFDQLEGAFKDRPEAEISAAFSELTSNLLLILTRLLGREMARSLAEELRAKASPQDGGTEQEGEKNDQRE
jgi:hypothetical protein